MQSRVLILDGEPSLAASAIDTLRRRGYCVDAFSDPEQALAAIGDGEPDAFLVDLAVGGDGHGVNLCERIRKSHRAVPVVIMARTTCVADAVAAIRAGAHDFLCKPVGETELGLVVDRVVKFASLEREVERLRAASASRSHGGLWGESPPMQEILELVRRVAASDASVLISGESGTGKELVARAIHDASGRRGRLVPINCAAVPASLLESELFGHVQGAFTDAREPKRGLFVDADGGTVFLDEVAEMPLALQPKLLRALQERTVRPVGGTVEHDFDARVIVATNRDLEAEVAAGRFRQDLFYRINVVHLKVPPLRVRGGDILVLAQHFLRRAAERAGKGISGLTPQAAERLMAHDFPGNVRELENAMERAVALARYDRITIDDLPERIRADAAGLVVVGAEDPSSLSPMSEVERRYIRSVLQATNGNKSRAAEILGIDRRTLHRKLQRYGIGGP